jgi:hypothetical protein
MGLVAEAGRRRHREVDVAGAVVQGVGRAAGDQVAHVRGDRRDRLDGADVVRRRDDPQRLHVLAEQGGLAHRQDHPVLAVAGGPLEQRVVDVGHVLHVAHVAAGVAPGPVDQVERDHRGGVAEVGGVVRGDATDVHRRRGIGRAGLD